MAENLCMTFQTRTFFDTFDFSVLKEANFVYANFRHLKKNPTNGASTQSIFLA